MTLNQIIGNKEKTSRIDTELWKKMNEKYPDIKDKTSTEKQPKKKLEQKINYVKYGHTFYELARDTNNQYLGVPIALSQALHYATPEGYVATLPELIAAKIKAKKNHELWLKNYHVHTEENIGIDKKGLHYKKNDPILVIVNGGGILTPERIIQAYNEKLIHNKAKYSNEEFDKLLEEKLPDNTKIKLYPFEEIIKGMSNLPHKFGIVMPYEIAKKSYSGFFKKEGLLKNPLAIARAGGIENLEKYFELAKTSDGELGCYHSFPSENISIPLGDLLSIQSNYCGIQSVSINNNSGHFFAVAPKIINNQLK